MARHSSAVTLARAAEPEAESARRFSVQARAVPGTEEERGCQATDVTLHLCFSFFAAAAASKYVAIGKRPRTTTWNKYDAWRTLGPSCCQKGE